MLPSALQPSDYPVSFGAYMLLECLGRGAFARVFLAELQGMAGFRKLVALKVVNDSYASRAADFIREGRLCGLLKHRNIVDTYQMGMHEGQLYIAMEPVDGISLAEVRSLGPLPPSVVLEIGLAVCRGLSYTHALQDRTGPWGWCTGT